MMVTLQSRTDFDGDKDTQNLKRRRRLGKKVAGDDVTLHDCEQRRPTLIRLLPRTHPPLQALAHGTRINEQTQFER
jgi:hypothetical protein